MIGLRRGVVGKTVDPNLKLELKFNTNTFTDLLGNDPAGANDYVRSWRSTVGGHLLTQAMDAARPQRVSDGIYFDGGDGLSTPFVLATRSPWTFEWWQYDSNNTNTVGMVTISPDKLYLEWFTQTFYLGDGFTNNIAFATTRPVATWYHLAVSFDGTTYRLYKNGIQLISTATALQAATSTSIEIGNRTTMPCYMLGKLTDIRFYNSCIYPNGTTFTPPTRSA